jgi:tol-pal system protein YbgF
VPKTLTRVLLVAALGLAPGCASQLSELKQTNHRLSEQVTTLRAEQRTDKGTIRDLENQIFVLKDKLETAEVGAGKTPGAMPRLPVEVLAPRASARPAAAPQVGAADPPAGDSDLSDLGDGARLVGVADDGTQIVYVGDAAAGRAAPPADPDPDREPGPPPAPAASRRPRPAPSTAAPRAVAPVPEVGADDRLAVERAVPRVSAVSAHRPSPPSRADRPDPRDPRSDYQAAVDALKNGDHAAAIAGLRDFVRRWPDHDYADNAQYWLGEAYYDQKDYRRALEEFRKTVERYPKGNKVPDALLKVGFCYAALGQNEQARATLDEVVSVYPRTGPAQLAASRLDTLGK